MLFKLEEVIKEKTKTTNNVIKDQQQFEDFTNRLIERKIILMMI